MNDLIKRLRAIKYTRERGDGHNGEYYIEPCDVDDYGAEATNRNPDGPEAADRLTELEAENTALKAAMSDEGELLTIAWMDGSHRSTKAHRARLTAMKAAGDGLAKLLTRQGQHSGPCMDQEGPDCNCGLTTALKQWKEASDGLD